MDTEAKYSQLDSLAASLEGDLKYDKITRTIYSTDASVYKEMPFAVTWPKNISDIKKIVLFASRENIGITMRAAGTSLAGQVVSSGIIVDISRYMKRIIEINDKHLMRVAVCDKCRIKLISGSKVQETADNILENHKKHWRKEKKGAPQGFKDFKVSDPNTNHQKHLRKKISNKLSE